jgi:RimJ/RimL family protein N-acetyltransferase
MTPRDDLVLVRTPRIHIRTKTREDAEDDYRWRRDPELMRFDGVPPTDESFAEFLRRFQADLQTINPARQMFAVDTVEGHHIGNVMYYNADSIRGTAEVGVSLGEESYRGRGLGSESMTAFVFYLWHSRPYRTLFLHTLEWNERAQRSFARSGFSATSRIVRGNNTYIRMEAHREWWLMHFDQGRIPLAPGSTDAATQHGEH